MNKPAVMISVRPPQSWCYVFEKEVAANDKA